MALVTQMVDVPLTSGVDSKTADFTSSPPGTAQFSTISNMRSDYRAGFVPRVGYTANTTSDQTAPAWIASTSTSTVFNRGQRIFGDLAAGGPGNDLAGPGVVKRFAFGTKLDQDPVSISAVTHADRVFLACAYPASGSALSNTYQWYNPTTEAPTFSGGFIGTRTDIKATSGPSRAFIWGLNGTSLTAYGATVDSTGNSFSLSGFPAIVRFDIAYDSISGTWFIIYVEGGDTKLAQVTLATTTFTLGTPVTLTANAAENVTLSLAAGQGATTYISLAYFVAATPAVTAALYTRANPPVSAASTAISAPVSPIWGLGVCDVGTWTGDTQIFAITFDKYTSSFLPSRYAYTLTSTGGASTLVEDVVVPYGAISQPVVKRSVGLSTVYPYVVATDIQNSGTYSSAGWGPPNAFGQSYRWSCASAVGILSHRGYSIATLGSKYCIPQVWEGRVESLTAPTSGFAATSTQQMVGLVVIDEGQSTFASTFSFGTAQVLAAGGLYGIDTQAVGQQNCWPIPAIVASSIVASNGAGTLDNSSLYSYRLVKRWSDSLGNVQECVSPAFKVTTGGTDDTIAFSVTEAAFTTSHVKPTQSSNTQILIYRTEGNGSVHYYHSTLLVPTNVTDTTPDASLTLTDALVYDGGELEDQELSHITHMTPWQGRLVALTADYSTKVYYSKPPEAFRSVRFAAGLEIDFPQAEGGLTAIAGMDYTLYGFTKNAIFTVSGQPAGATGEGGSIGSPEVRFNGIGCVNPKSVILTPKGLAFQSSKGIYLILRNQELAFIGEGPFESRATTIVGAYVDETRSELHYTLSTGVEWVYDWQNSLWTSFTLPGTPLAISMQGSTPHFLTTTKVYELDSSSTEVIPITMTTDWVALTGIQGFQRVRNIELLLEYVASHTLQVDVYTDYDDTTAVQTSTITSAAITPAVVVGKAYQVRVHVQNQKCEAIKVKLSSAVAGWKISGITLEVGAKADHYKPRAQTTPNTI